MRVKVKTSFANSMLLVQFGVSSSMFIVSRAVRTVSSLTYWPPSVGTMGPRSPPYMPPRRRPPPGPNCAKQTLARGRTVKRKRNLRETFIRVSGSGLQLRISQDVLCNRVAQQNEMKVAENAEKFNLRLAAQFVQKKTPRVWRLCKGRLAILSYSALADFSRTMPSLSMSS